MGSFSYWISSKTLMLVGLPSGLDGQKRLSSLSASDFSAAELPLTFLTQ